MVTAAVEFRARPSHNEAMKYTPLTLAASAFLFAIPAAAQVGQPLPKVDLEVVHPAAKTFDAFQGRLVLVEFFAHW